MRHAATRRHQVTQIHTGMQLKAKARHRADLLILACRIRAAIVCLAALFCASEAAAAQGFVVDPAPEWTALFDRDSGWTGADGIYSIPLTGVDVPSGAAKSYTLFVFSDTFIGDVALSVAAVTWALYSVLVRRVSARFVTLVVTLLAFLGGMLVAVPAMVVELTVRPVGAIDGGIILGVLYLGVVSTAGAMWLWNRAFALVDASIAALFFFTQPVVGALLSVFFLGQRMTLNLWVGGVLVVIGVLLSLSSSSRNGSGET